MQKSGLISVNKTCHTLILRRYVKSLNQRAGTVPKTPSAIISSIDIVRPLDAQKLCHLQKVLILRAGHCISQRWKRANFPRRVKHNSSHLTWNSWVSCNQYRGEATACMEKPWQLTQNHLMLPYQKGFERRNDNVEVAFSVKTSSEVKWKIRSPRFGTRDCKQRSCYRKLSFETNTIPYGLPGYWQDDYDIWRCALKWTAISNWGTDPKE